MSLMDDKERYLRQRLERANSPASGFAIMTDLDRWLTRPVDSACFRGNLGLLTVSLRSVGEDEDFEARKARNAWARVLRDLVAAGDLVAVLVVSMLRAVFVEHDPALGRDLERLLAGDPAARLAHDLFNGDRYREVVATVAARKPPTLMLALVSFVGPALSLCKGRRARRRDLVRVLLALDAYGEPAVLHMLACESTRQVPFMDHLARGLLVDLLPARGIRSLLRTVFEPETAGALPMQLQLAEALRHCRREDLVNHLTEAMLHQTGDQTRGILADVARGVGPQPCRMKLPGELLPRAVELLRADWVPACVKQELMGAALAASAKKRDEPTLLARLLDAVPRTAPLDRYLLDALLSRSDKELPGEQEMAHLQPLIFGP